MFNNSHPKKKIENINNSSVYVLHVIILKTL